MNGKEFKRQILAEKERTGDTIKIMAEKADIFLRTLYLQFDRTDDVPDEYITKLNAVGYKIHENVDKIHGPDSGLMQQMINLIKEGQKDFQKSKDQLERENETLVKNNAVLLSNNKTLLSNNEYLLKVIEEISPQAAKRAKKDLKTH